MWHSVPEGRVFPCAAASRKLCAVVRAFFVFSSALAQMLYHYKAVLSGLGMLQFSSAQSLPAVLIDSLPSCDKLPSAIICEDWSSGMIRHEQWRHEVSATGGGNGEFQLYTQHPKNSFVANVHGRTENRFGA